jgi:hypothetical protein
MACNPRVRPHGTCPACGHRFDPDDEVIVVGMTRPILCASHRDLISAGTEVITGKYAEVKTQTPEGSR